MLLLRSKDKVSPCVNAVEVGQVCLSRCFSELLRFPFGRLRLLSLSAIHYAKTLRCNLCCGDSSFARRLFSDRVQLSSDGNWLHAGSPRPSPSEKSNRSPARIRLR